MTAPTVYELKRGATLSLAGTVTLPAGTWAVQCQVRKSTSAGLELVEALSVDLVPGSGRAPHTILIEATSTMSGDWPEGTRLQCDVAFFDDSTPPVVLPSPTFVIKVVPAVTEIGA